MFVPDASKTLPVLQQQWEQCRNCSLGVYRESVGGNFVPGEGTQHGVLFVGDGPGRDEEREGKPFVGDSGELLRTLLDAAQLTSVSYLTSGVACRSCAQAYDSEGKARTNDRGHAVIVDQSPTTVQLSACAARLYEEIYLVDPVLIVVLGEKIAEFLLHRSVSVMAETGSLHTVKIPGAAHRAVLTEKKQQWLRKVRGGWVMPTVQNEVEYSCLLNMHPSFVLQKFGDKRPNNPTDRFYRTLLLAKKLYDQHQQEVFGSTQTP